MLRCAEDPISSAYGAGMAKMALNAEQAAAELGVSPWSIYRLIERGVIPATRLGPKLLRIQRRRLEEFINGETR